MVNLIPYPNGTMVRYTGVFQSQRRGIGEIRGNTYYKSLEGGSYTYDVYFPNNAPGTKLCKVDHNFLYPVPTLETIW